ncbi:MAG: FAD-dependent oxidoreductase [Clostridium sp.]
MIRVNQLKLPITHDEAAIAKKVGRLLKLRPEKISSIKIVKQSLDARKKEELLYIYSVDVKSEINEEAVVENAKNVNVLIQKDKTYRFPTGGAEILKHRPVIIGCGPAGLFCGLMLAKAGYAPILLERGEDVDARKKRVDGFWEGGALSADSNVQFGEGGAGTFSDGKLNTLLKDPQGRNLKILELLVEAGADPSILYVNKPHIGTDVLSQIVKNIREEIIKLGGEVRFNSKVTDLVIENQAITGVVTEKETLSADAVILAIGHSARDTFEMLSRKPLSMQAKSFAVGLRIQHPQKQINLSQYGIEDPGKLGAADYKLTRQTKSGRGVYSFCMCPGGFVVNASSEENRLVVNGMSNHSRDGVNGNSAMIVTVTPEDFPDQTPLGGVAFQRQLEEAAFCCGNGKIPVQLYGDFKNNRISTQFGDVKPEFKGAYAFGNLREILPGTLSDALIEGIDSLGNVLKGFNRQDAILAGVESRTSSPIRIPRNDNFESDVKGLYPCGEGAGYAGGITSAAMDGLKIAEVLAMRFAKKK